MPDLEISNLPALAEAGVAATDPIAIADLSASETKKVTVKDLIEAGVALIDTASIPAAKVGTLGTDQVATGAIVDGAVTNVKLANSSVSLGGVSIALGATDATPAFNLADATGYTTANLSGTISNAQLAGSIANSKLANSSVSLGGISVSLGGTDATPAFNLTDATGYKTTELVGTITNAQLAGSIDVSKLVGSTISLGGITIALGGTDATPAFNLTDATGYPTSSLVGTITNAQLAGSVANAKLANSSVTLGGVSIALGASDATPAFDLTDATNYPASSLSGTITNAQLAGSIAVSKLASSSASIGGVTITLGATDATPAFDLQDATGYLTTALVGTITNAQLAGSIAATKLVSGSITSTQLGTNSVTDSELANNAVDTGAVQNGAITNDKVETSTNSSTGLDGATKIRDATITPAKLNTSNLDRSLNVASGNLGINNVITAATRSGFTYNAQGLITGTVALAAADLPVATSSAVGGVSVSTGLTVSGAGALSLTNSVTGATVSGITFNNQGMITAATALVAGDLPVATTSAKGAVQITSGGGLTVDGSGNLTTSTSGISAGTYQSVTVNNKGVITAGAALTAGLIPDLAASKITSGSIDAARIGTDSIDGTKLSNSSTAVFQSIAQSGYPTAQFNGQILFDTVSEDAFIWDGNAWQAITTLTKGSLVFGGNYNASTSKMTACTTAGLAAGLAVGSNLPTPSATTDGLYVVVDTAGTPSAPAPVVSFSPPDYILGVTNSSGSSWNEIDLSQTVAGQVASNITFTPYGQLSSTNVQDALQELETEKMGFAGGTVSGQLLIGNTGSLAFEGSTVDAYELTLTVADPQGSDKTITFPDVTGTVVTTGDTGTVTSAMLANGTILNVDINASAAIALSKLQNVTAAQIIVGNGSNVPTAVAVTGDISINNAGLTAIAAGVIVDADISGSAQITGSKVVTGTTSAVGVLQLTNAADSTSATTAATPAAVKIAKDAADAAATTANAALPKAGGTMTDHLIIDNGKELRLSESDGDGTNYTGLKAQAQSGDITLTLPAVAPTANQVLKADASTPTTLTWAADSATDATKMPLAGGTFTGDVTFTGDASDGLWDKSASAFVANLTGNVTGNVSGSSSSCTGNAATATVLATARAINGVNFNGSAPITITAAAGTLTGATLASGVTASSLTSVGTLTGLTTSGNVNLNAQADLRFKDSDSSHYVALQSPATVASSFTLTLPSSDAAVSGYVLASDGSGTLSWVDPGSSSSPTFTGDATLTNDGALVGFSTLNATYTGNTKTLTVTVASKTGAHRYSGSGSSSGYKIGGKESPFLTLTPGRTYKFDQADNSNSGHPLRFYLEADKTTAYTTGVTTSGSAGSSGAYTQIVVSDTTPQILHYQCSAHGLMGNSVQTNSNIASTAKTLATARTIGGVSFDGTAAIDLPGVNTAGNQNTSGTAALATQFTVTANNSTDETVYPLFSDGAAGSQGAETDTGLTYNPSTGLLTSTGFSGAGTSLTALNASNISSGTIAAARVPTLNQNTTGTAATVTGAAQSAITSLGTLTGLTVDGDVQFSGTANNVVWDKSDNALEFQDAAKLKLGSDDDIVIHHTGGYNYIEGALRIGKNNSVRITDANDDTRLQVTNTGATVTGTLVADGLTVDTNTLHVDATNNRVGIGITSPSSILHLQDSDNTVVHLGNSSYDDGVIQYYNGSLHLKTGSSNGDRNIGLFTAGSERMRIDSSGRVGIGTTSPQVPLEIYGANDGGDLDLLNLRNGGGTGSNVAINFISSTDATNTAARSYIKSLRSGSGSNLAFATSNTERVRIDSSGRLLLGTTTEGAVAADNLTISDSGNCGISIRSGTSSNASIYFSDATSGTAEYEGYVEYNHSNNQLRLASNHVVALTLDSSQNATFAGTVSDSKGDLRKIPQNWKTAAYTLIASDSGKHILTTGGTVTIPSGVFAAAGGDAITIGNHSGSDITIAQGSGLTMYNTADGSTGNRTLAGRGMCTLLFVNAGACYISGAGLS